MLKILPSSLENGGTMASIPRLAAEATVAGLQAFYAAWAPPIDAECRMVLSNDDAMLDQHFGMMHYHMGWVDDTMRPNLTAQGKRIRPILCLLSCAAMQGDPAVALPAAAGVEIAHNYSLIHDDLEDGDVMRRHRPTVWKLWGVPQAVNVGDAMYAFSFAAMHRLADAGVPAPRALATLRRFTEACVALTAGQHLDIRFEDRDQVSVAEYLTMIRGKTAALLAASAAIGALLGGGDEEQVDAFHRFGEAIGLAFQIQDDILGIWGDPTETGKATGNDIMRGKKSLPLLYALTHPRWGSQIRSLWGSELTPDHLLQVMDLLERTDARRYAAAWLHRQHEAAFQALESVLGEQAQESLLWALAGALLDRTA